MPLIQVPIYLGPSIILDMILSNKIKIEKKSITSNLEERENINPQTQPQDQLGKRKSIDTKLSSEDQCNKNISPQQNNFFKKRKKHGARLPFFIYSAKGRELLKDEDGDDNSIEDFISENNICDFDTFLNAIKSGSLEDLLKLNFVINHFSAIDAMGNNALIQATLLNKVPIMKYLLERNASVNFKNSNQCSALDIAAWLGLIDAVELLIIHDACEDIYEEECGALFHARQQGHAIIVNKLTDKIKQNYDNYMAKRRPSKSYGYI